MSGVDTRDPALLPVALDPTAFRAAMSRFPTGVTLVTRGGPAALEAVTINSFVSVSLDPLLVLVTLRTTSRMRAELDTCAGFAVHVLDAAQTELAALFARPDRPTGSAAARRLGAVASPAGNVLLPGVLATFECEHWARHPAGDHVLYVGGVVAIHLAQGERTPLLFHRGRYGAPR
ncbi:flavin reductase family protein [Plantactinospora sp. B24E8]|uniref:flavin reductase family protein n=1 Tax=Plantactinospora sp. B24E8 TaxID=3153567 RepID=UPI00325D30BD